jgi:hypothetical protein
MMNLVIPQVRFLYFESHLQQQHHRDEDDGLWWYPTTQTDREDIPVSGRSFCSAVGCAESFDGLRSRWRFVRHFSIKVVEIKIE